MDKKYCEHNMKECRLKKYLDEPAYKKVIKLYCSLHGKENLEKRLFLKALVYAGILQRGNNNYVNINTYLTFVNFDDRYISFLDDSKRIEPRIYGINYKEIWGHIL